jgi:2-hydroxychromene-2-carboxylate isomerase
MVEIEFYFDCSSPWTYLAFHNIQPLAAETGARIAWKPILVGGIFNTVNKTVYESREKPHPIKSRYYKKDLQDWARFTGLRIAMPPVFPVNSVKAMRGAFVAIERNVLPLYARTVFETYWGDLQDISQDSVMESIVEKVGLDRGDFFARIGAPEYKDRLRTTTEELIARGGFGSPTMYVAGDDMYFGNDRLPLVRAAVLAAQGKLERTRAG